jgi:hypothetical protein
MIIGVSIVDKHKPEGQRHVGTYCFEIDYDANSHFEILALPCPSEKEAEIRPHLNVLLKEQAMKERGMDPVRITDADESEGL